MKKGNKNVGYVEWFDNQRGYGFIKMKDDPDSAEYFVHYSAIITGETYKTLKAEQEVTFNLQKTEKGVQAIDVEVIS